MTETTDRRNQPQHIVDVPNSVNMVSLLGPNDEHLAILEKVFDADIHVRGNRVTLRGESAELALAERLIDELVTILRTGQGLTPETVERAAGMLRAESQERPADVLSLNILSNRGRTIRPKTLNQKRYVDAIDKHTIVFGIGPAGTGKTYLAMAKAVQALQNKQVNRIILTRPAVEAGERLGFLPGTLSEKIDPYLRPLYDALHDMLDPETIPKLLAAGTIEVAPLAYMRGRSLNDAFIILDEAQNTSPEQMKMFLTRLGFGSKIVVTGDVTQVDLPGGTQSGLRVVEGILDGVEDLSFNRLTAHDVVRHRLVGRIVAAYDEFEARSPTGERPVATGARTAREQRDPAGELERPRGDAMSIEVLEESGAAVDAKRMVQLCRFVIERLRIHPLAELCIKLVDEDTITELNEQWMDKEGPTDVLAFPMDELRPGLVNDEPEPGVLGDIMLCPQIAEAQATEARERGQAGYTTTDEIDLLTVHGILHLSATTTPSPTSTRRCSVSRRDCSRSGRACSWATGPSDAGRGTGDDDVSAGDPWLVALAAVLVVVAGVFSSADAALASVSRVRAQELRRRGESAAPAGCCTIAEDPPRYLNTALFLRMFCEIAAVVLMTEVVLRLARRRAPRRPRRGAADAGRPVRRDRGGPADGRAPARPAGGAAQRRPRGGLHPHPRPAAAAAHRRRQHHHARARASARARSPPRPSCASWSTWPRPARSSSPASGR